MAVKPIDENAATQLHLNMMTDTLIANLSEEGLRSILRSLIAIHPQITASFESHVRQFVHQRAKVALHSRAEHNSLDDLRETQKTIRCMLGSGLVLESLPLLSRLVGPQVQAVAGALSEDPDTMMAFVASADGDIVQAMTAVEKTLKTPAGARELNPQETDLIRNLFDVVLQSDQILYRVSGDSSFDRSLAATSGMLSLEVARSPQSSLEVKTQVAPPPPAKETFTLATRTLPRIFSGLWQMSSPAWGSAPTSKVIQQFDAHVQHGFTAFDMADHYGDAELIFGRFRAAYAHPDAIFAATKLCVFHQTDVVTRQMMVDSISERCRRLQTQKLDLLQFHWQHYEDVSYIDALRYIATDDRVGMLGLCNFDTENMQWVIDAGVEIHTNQVQFSLIDSRPVEKMAAVCIKHNIKLLTYGSLCGGFLSDKWLNQPEPNLYGGDGAITPSQRKYYSMISNWGGWHLLQELLHVLHDIATKHNVPGISNVATRWVLDQPCVGAVIIGARMGVQDHSDANLASFGWSLDSKDIEGIETILRKSRRKQIFEQMGDCGAEYRS